MIFQELRFGNFVEKLLEYRYFLKNFLKQKFMGCKLLKKITNLIRVQRKVSHKSNSKVKKQNTGKDCYSHSYVGLENTVALPTVPREFSENSNETQKINGK